MDEGRGQGQAALAAIGGAALLGLSPIFVRLSELGPVATNFWRFAIALPILGAWALASRRVPTAKSVAWLVLAGLFFGAEVTIWAEALFHTTVANATLLSNMTPIFAAGFAWLVFKERPAAGVFAGGAVALGGALILALARAQANAGPASDAADGWYGDALGLASATGYAAYLLIVRRMAGRASTGAVMLIATTAGAIFALGFVLALHQQLLPRSAQGWWVLVGLGVVVQAAAQGLIAYGVARLPIAASTVMLWAQPTTAALWSWALFGEAIGPLGLVGAVLIFAGIFLVQRARAPSGATA